VRQRTRGATVKDKTTPWRVIATDNPDDTLGEGGQTRHPTLLEAANAFVRHPSTYKTVIFDDGDESRELTAQEETLVHNLAAKLGYDVEGRENV
jgi:hypothetical protein